MNKLYVGVGCLVLLAFFYTVGSVSQGGEGWGVQVYWPAATSTSVQTLTVPTTVTTAITETLSTGTVTVQSYTTSFTSLTTLTATATNTIYTYHTITTVTTSMTGTVVTITMTTVASTSFVNDPVAGVRNIVMNFIKTGHPETLPLMGGNPDNLVWTGGPVSTGVPDQNRVEYHSSNYWFVVITSGLPPPSGPTTYSVEVSYPEVSATGTLVQWKGTFTDSVITETFYSYGSGKIATRFSDVGGVAGNNVIVSGKLKTVDGQGLGGMTVTCSVVVSLGEWGYPPPVSMSGSAVTGSDGSFVITMSGVYVGYGPSVSGAVQFGGTPSYSGCSAGVGGSTGLSVLSWFTQSNRYPLSVLDVVVGVPGAMFTIINAWLVLIMLGLGMLYLGFTRKK